MGEITETVEMTEMAGTTETTEMTETAETTETMEMTEMTEKTKMTETTEMVETTVTTRKMQIKAPELKQLQKSASYFVLLLSSFLPGLINKTCLRFLNAYFEIVAYQLFVEH